MLLVSSRHQSGVGYAQLAHSRRPRSDRARRSHRYCRSLSCCSRDSSSAMTTCKCSEDILFDRDVVADTSEFTLEPNSGGIIRNRRPRVDRRTTLWIGVLVVRSINEKRVDVRGDYQSNLLHRDRSNRSLHSLVWLGPLSGLEERGRSREPIRAVPNLRYR